MVSGNTHKGSSPNTLKARYRVSMLSWWTHWDGGVLFVRVDCSPLLAWANIKADNTSRSQHWGIINIGNGLSTDMLLSPKSRAAGETVMNL